MTYSQSGFVTPIETFEDFGMHEMWVMEKPEVAMKF